MGLTITFDAKIARRLGRNSPQGFISGSIAFDSSYPTGGEADTDLAAKFRTLQQVNIMSEDGYVFHWDKTNSKVMAYYADNDGASDSALIQVANTTDLSGITAARFTAFGLL